MHNGGICLRIEFGFQSDCSELLTHLGITSRDEVLKAIRTISRITGWIWGADSGYGKLIPIRPNEYDDVLVVEDELIGADSATLLSIWGDEFDRAMRSHLEKRTSHPKRFVQLLGLVLYEGPLDKVEKPRNGNYLRAKCMCDCERGGLKLSLTQDCVVAEMPAFHAVRGEFGSDIATHGTGSDDTYLLWMAYHFVDKKETERYLKRSTESERDAEKCISEFERHPPIDGSKPLTDEELRRIREGVLDEERYRRRDEFMEKWRRGAI